MPDDLLDDSKYPADSLKRLWVETEHNRIGFERLDALMAARTGGMVLCGPARTGKTHFLKGYLRSCARGEDGRKPLTYLYVKLTNDSKPTNIAYLTLHAMDDPSPAKGKSAERTARVLAAIKRRRYDLIIYDEAHELVDSETANVQKAGVGWFNGLLDGADCPIVLTGYKERLRSVLHTNKSLAGRLRTFPDFLPYRHGVADSLKEFRHVLREIEKGLGFPTPSNLWQPKTAARICYTCQGLIGFLEVFLEEARFLARKYRHSCLTPETLSEAAANVGRNFDNPFNAFAVPDLDEEIKKRKLA